MSTLLDAHGASIGFGSTWATPLAQPPAPVSITLGELVECINLAMPRESDGVSLKLQQLQQIAAEVLFEQLCSGCQPGPGQPQQQGALGSAGKAQDANLHPR